MVENDPNNTAATFLPVRPGLTQMPSGEILSPAGSGLSI